MPSAHHRSHNYKNSNHLPHLREILKLEPDDEPWCAGYAPSQGRRCHARTNAHGRRNAMALLNEGTKDLHSGYCIDELLEDLAPYVLCTRWHQNQASELVRKWKSRVDRFLDSCCPSSQRKTTRPSVSLSMSMQFSQRQSPAPRSVEASNARGVSISTAFCQPRTLQLSTRASGIATGTGTGTGTSRISIRTPEQPSRLTSRPSNHALDTNVSATLQQRHSAPVHTTTSTTNSVAESPRSRGTAVHRSRPLPSNTVSGDPRIQATLGRNLPQAHRGPISRDAPRRPVEGECSICLELLVGRSAGLDELDSSYSDSNDSDASDSEEDDDSGSDNDEDEEESSETELSWCKAQCGVNYHKACIDDWLRSPGRKTCPTCRTSWRS
ncbi:hypothetical protein BJY04DRAFT_69934 [Aspergillus karnatakaensis]|uniref:uncharacterized protein n=1 Tax=Aspergillus karnatakaensis TaxID=1810916 RepID=UPI003CCE1755